MDQFWKVEKTKKVKNQVARFLASIADDVLMNPDTYEISDTIMYPSFQIKMVNSVSSPKLIYLPADLENELWSWQC